MVVRPHVVIDVRMLRHTGIGTYIRNVVPRMIAKRTDWDFTLLTSRDPTVATEWADNGRVHVRPCNSDIYTIGEQLELPLRSPRKADLFWSPHYNIPLFSRIPLVVTVHDIMHLALPQMYGGGARSLYARHVFSAVRRNARVILFDSDFTRADFERQVGHPRNSATVHLGVDAEWRTPSRQPPPTSRPYVLFVGSIKPHKNIGALVHAFETLLPTIDHDLVIIGNYTNLRTGDADALRVAARLAPRVRLLGNVDDATLKAYVSHATALVLPSLYEGFGLPALEAMASGCPCVVSTAGSLPEVCGDAVLYCDPHSPADIAQKIARIVGDETLRARLIAAGTARAAQFTWERAASETEQVLERTLAH